MLTIFSCDTSLSGTSTKPNHSYVKVVKQSAGFILDLVTANLISKPVKNCDWQVDTDVIVPDIDQWSDAILGIALSSKIQNL